MLTFLTMIRSTCFTSLCCAVVLFINICHKSMGFNLTILHTNDVRARYEPVNNVGGACSKRDIQVGECYGGMARLQTKVKQHRASSNNTLLIDGGDQYQGTEWFVRYGGNVTAHYMNLIGYDAMVLGNHEFDHGPSGLDVLMLNAKFHILSCNINASLHQVLADHLKPSVILTVGGEQIGIVGYTTVETKSISNPGVVTFSDEIEAVRREVTKLQNAGVNKIIALSHAGFTKDLQVARDVSGIDVIVGGHTNTFLYTGDPPSTENATGGYPGIVRRDDGSLVLVVQVYYIKYLGVLQIQFDENGIVVAWAGNPVLLDQTVPEDSAVLQDLAVWRAGVDAFANQTMGKSVVSLDRTFCRKEECNIGNLITDAMLMQNLIHSDSLEWNHVAIAIMNAGGIRNSIGKGDITMADIRTVQPFKNSIDIVELNGTTLRAIFERSAAVWNPEAKAPGFLQHSGIQVVYDISKPVGQRVHQLKVRCADCQIPTYDELEPNKAYKVIMHSFLAYGGDGYSVIKNNTILRHINGDLDTDVLTEYIQNFSPIIHGIEGRIRFVNGTESCDVEKISILSLALGLSSAWILLFIFICLGFKFKLFTHCRSYCHLCWRRKSLSWSTSGERFSDEPSVCSQT